MKIVGKAVSHESAAQHVDGSALYTDDILNRFPNLLYAWPLQAKLAHAKIITLNTKPALEIAGVVKVLSKEDVPGVNDSGMRDDEPLFPSKVMYYGQALCWVLADSEEAARLGSEAIEVVLEELPPILQLSEAIAAKQFQGSALHAKRGNAEEAFSSCAHTLEGTTSMGGQEHFYLETQSSLAHLDESGGIVVYASTQHPTETQEIVAHVLGTSRNWVTVRCLRMGGGFGGKETQANPYAAIAALGTKLTGRPTRVRLNRTQDITLSGKRHPFFSTWKVGFSDDGKLQTLKAELFSDGGWSQDLSEPVLARAICHIDNAYFIPHVDVLGRVCQTNKTSQTAFRGFGGPQGMVIAEDILGRVARHLGIAPHKLRERNFYSTADEAAHTTHYRQIIKNPERIHAVWDDLKTRSDFENRLQEIQEWNLESPHSKRGLAITPVKFGISFNLTAFNQAGALVLIFQDGTIQVNHGGTEMGQGLHTKILQVAAQAFGVGLERIRMMTTSTDKVPNTSATAASTGSDLNGAAVLDACLKIKSKLADVAARKLNVEASEIIFKDEKIGASGSETIGFAELVQMAYRERVQLFSDGFYSTPGLSWDKTIMQGHPFHYFSFGAACTEVEIDSFTGHYGIRRTDIVHDVGDSLSPAIDLGQIEGGFVQGAGWLTLEDLRWEENGQVATRSASTYKLPSISEMPKSFNVHFLENAHESGVVFGSKAVGEPPLMLAISVREALRAAIHAFGENPVNLLPSPLTPEAVYWAVQTAKGAIL